MAGSKMPQSLESMVRIPPRRDWSGDVLSPWVAAESVSTTMSEIDEPGSPSLHANVIRAEAANTAAAAAADIQRLRVFGGLFMA